MAKRFRNAPGIVGYNLFNEPWMGTPLQQCALSGGGTSPDACGISQFEATTLTDFHRRVTRAIRRVDKRTMVFPAPILTFDFGGVTGVGKVDKRAGLAFNAYCGQRDPAIGALLPFLVGKPCSFSANLSFTHALDESRRNGDALFMTELGATDDLSGFADYLNGANALSLSWTYWAYWNTDPSGPRPLEGLLRDIGQPPVGSNVKTEKLMALAQPYARVTAGTPRQWAFDPATHTFRFVYKTSPARKKGAKFEPGSVTKLSIPGIQYPAGYRVRIRGARVVSRPRAGTLRLAQCGHAKTVKLTVTQGKTPRGRPQVRHGPELLLLGELRDVVDAVEVAVRQVLEHHPLDSDLLELASRSWIWATVPTASSGARLEVGLRVGRVVATDLGRPRGPARAGRPRPSR